METIANRVIDLTKEHLGLEGREIHRSSLFIDDLGADSLDVLELVITFEQEFNIEISDEEVEKVLTVQNTIDLITSIKGD